MSHDIRARRFPEHGDWLIENGHGRVVRIPETAIRRRLGMLPYTPLTALQVEMIGEALLIAPHKHAGRLERVEEMEDWQRHYQPPPGFTPPPNPFTDTDDSDDGC